MTQISKLTNESINPSSEDYMVVDNGILTQKVKIKNLPFTTDTSDLEDEIDNLQTSLNAKANSTDVASTVSGLQQVDSGLQNQINSKASTTDVNNALTGKVDSSTFTNTVSVLQSKDADLQAQINSSSSALANKADKTTVDNLQVQVTSNTNNLQNKSNVGHGHQINDVSGLQTALDSKLSIGTIINGFDYNQQTVPSNPLVGQTWRERKSNGLILRDWEWDGVDWISIQEFSQFLGILNGQAHIFTSASTSTNSDNFFVQYNTPPVMGNGNKGILFLETCLHIATQTPNDMANYWRFRPAYIATASGTNLTGEFFSSEVGIFSNIERWIIHNLKAYRQTFSNTNFTGFRMGLRSYGNPGQINWCSNTSWKIIR